MKILGEGKRRQNEAEQVLGATRRELGLGNSGDVSLSRSMGVKITGGRGLGS